MNKAPRCPIERCSFPTGPAFRVLDNRGGGVVWVGSEQGAERVAEALRLLDASEAGRERLRELLALRVGQPKAEQLLVEVAACLTAVADLEECREADLTARHLTRAIASLGRMVDVEIDPDPEPGS